MNIDSFAFMGGMDTVTPYLNRQPGSVLAANNWEPEMDGGYAILPGFERFDGNTAPSSLVLYAVEVDSVAGVTLVKGDVFTASGSGATGYFGELSGNHILYAPKSGQVVVGDVIDTATATTDGLPSEYLVDTPPNLLSELRVIVRGNILAVPGEGPIRGVWKFKGITYAFRDNVGATVCDIYKSTPAGWELVSFADQLVLDFKDATEATPFAVGDIITTPSADTATVRSVSNTASDRTAGYLVIDNITGTFSDGDSISGATIETFAKTTSAPFDRVRLDYRNGITEFVIGNSVIGGTSASEGLIWFLEYTTISEGILYLDIVTPGFVNGEELKEKISGDVYSFAASDGIPGTMLYTDGTYAFSDGEFVTGVTSGATGTINRVVAETALFLTDVTGTFVDGEELTVTPIAIVDGTPAAVVILPGGDYAFDTYNFFADQGRNSIYGADGVNRAFAFDGEVYTPIRTGVEEALDKPFLCFEHVGHLFVSYVQGSLQHSVVGEPLNWNGALGAFEFGMGAEITNVIRSPSSLVVTTDANVQVIYGAGITSWGQSTITDEASGFARTGHFLGRPYIFSEGGLMALDLVESFGNFKDSIISDAMQNIMDKLEGRTTCAIVDPDRAQYIIFTDTGINYTFTFKGGQLIGIMPFSVGFRVDRAVRTEGEIYFINYDKEFVYNWRKGTSYDGVSREVILKLSYAFQGAPTQRKRYRRATVSIKARGQVSIQMSFDFSKGSAANVPSLRNLESLGGAGQWDLASWNEATWDGQNVPEFFTDIDGVGTDVSVTFYIEGVDIPNLSLEDIVFEYSPRGRKR